MMNYQAISCKTSFKYTISFKLWTLFWQSVLDDVFSDILKTSLLTFILKSENSNKIFIKDP